MKKIFYLMAIAIATLTFSACSDNDDNFVVNDNQSEVSIDRIGGEIVVPVTTTGKWTAELDDNSRKWAKVWTGEGEGSGKAVVYVSHLDPRKQIHERKTTLTITADGKKKTVNIRQFIGLVDGETAKNEGEIYADLWNGKSIGYGLDPITGNLSTDPLVNLYGLNALIRRNPGKYAQLYSQSYIPRGEGNVSLSDTLEDNIKTIEADAHLDLTYAKVKFSLDVNFKNYGRQYRRATQWVGSYNIVRMRGSLALSNIRSFISRDPNLLGEETTMLLSPLAQEYYLEMKEAYEAGDDATFKEIVYNLCDEVGPLVVTYAELGGGCNIQLIYDEYLQEDSFKVGGKATLGINAGIFQLNADVDVKYSKFGEDIWKNSHHFINVSGGSDQAMKKMMAALESGTDSLAIIRENIRVATEEWANSIICYETPEAAKQGALSGNEDNTALVSVRYAGVWTAFPLKYQSKIKQYIVEKYKGRENELVTQDLAKLGLVNDNNQVVRQ